MSPACGALMVAARELMPPLLLAIALRMVLGELAAFRTLKRFSVAAPWQLTQLAA